MTSDLGQQQFNLSNLSAREHLPCHSSGIFVPSCRIRIVRYKRAATVTSHVRVELFKKQLSILKTIRDHFIVSGDYFRGEMFRVTARGARFSRYLQRIFSRRVICERFSTFHKVSSLFQCEFKYGLNFNSHRSPHEFHSSTAIHIFFFYIFIYPYRFICLITFVFWLVTFF